MLFVTGVAVAPTGSTTAEDADTPVPVIDMDVHLSSPWGNESSLTLTLTIRKDTFLIFSH